MNDKQEVKEIRLSVTSSSIAFKDYDGKIHYSLLHEVDKNEEVLDDMIEKMWRMMKGKIVRVICLGEFDITFPFGYLKHYDNAPMISKNPVILDIRDRLIKLNERDL